jgi:aminoglycoside/choline kinase family phosphotransferase
VTDDAQTRLQEYLDQHGLTPDVTTVLPLTGDASDRQYFRVLMRDGDSIVLALHAGPIDFASLPFVTVSGLMRAIPLPVPELLHHSNALGIIAQQDLGDVTLQAHLGAASAEEHAALYREAVLFVARLQQRGHELASLEYPPYQVAFDTDKLSWELEFFYKYFIQQYRGASPGLHIQQALSQEWSAIVEELAAESRVLCHRDYHSRNLMLHGDSLYIIDFQDARMGPDTYDLASLLRDSYVDLTPSQVDELIAYFVVLTRGGGGSADVTSEFRRRFDLMALQRNLKALGTFGYQTVTRGNTVYIQYIPRTLNYVRANLTKYPRFGRLQELLAGIIDELG